MALVYQAAQGDSDFALGDFGVYGFVIPCLVSCSTWLCYDLFS